MNISNTEFEFVKHTWTSIHKKIQTILVGNEILIDKLLTATALKSHVLVEGLPGLAKTLIVNLLARVTNARWSRIQFTPDLLPADITGTMIYNQNTKNFTTHKGPIFSNFVIADEINRAPAKVHSALLQAMEEKSVMIGKEVHPLPKPFVVMATQNPIEQEGTYELPEAQKDRFLFKLLVEHPTLEQEVEILSRADILEEPVITTVCSLSDIEKIGAISHKIQVSDAIRTYIARIILATRKIDPKYRSIDYFIEHGASPRASLAILRTARMHALRMQRDYVTPEDVKAVVADILRHRIILSFDAIANNTTTDGVIKNILSYVSVP